MTLSAEEARVLAALIEKQATVPDSYPLSLNALRLACNQTTNRFPVVAYEDRTVEAALMSLKSIGLVRFVLPSHGGRTIRYRHVADERWRLSAGELAVLSVLVLCGAQTASEVRARAARLHHLDSPSDVDDALDTLASRSPEPLATRVGRRPGERDQRWADLLSGEPPASAPPPPDSAPLRHEGESAPSGELASPGAAADRWRSLAAEVDKLRTRLDRLERSLGLDDGD